MENNRHENPRVTRTRKSVQEAFKILVMQGKSEDINVKKIAEMAGIHRKTFYLHYTCIEALYEDMIQTIVSEYGKEVEKLSVPYDYYDLTKVMFHFYSGEPFREKLITDVKYQDFISKIVATNLSHNRSFYNPFETFSADEQMLINIFLAGASMDVLRQWINSGKKVPVDRVIQLTGELLEKGVSALREKSGVGISPT